MQAYIVLSLRALDHSLETFNLRPTASQCIPVHPCAASAIPGNYNRGAPLVPHKGVGNDVVIITSGQERHLFSGGCHYDSVSPGSGKWTVHGLGVARWAFWCLDCRTRALASSSHSWHRMAQVQKLAAGFRVLFLGTLPVWESAVPLCRVAWLGVMLPSERLNNGGWTHVWTCRLPFGFAKVHASLYGKAGAPPATWSQPVYSAWKSPARSMPLCQQYDSGNFVHGDTC